MIDYNQTKSIKKEVYNKRGRIVEKYYDQKSIKNDVAISGLHCI